MDDALNKSGNEILQLVTFSIGEEDFGVDILKVQEIIRMMDIIVIEMNGIIVGFVVDAVSEVLRIPKGTVEPAPPVVAGVDADYISGVGKLEDRLLILLDLDKLLSSEDFEMLCEM